LDDVKVIDDQRRVRQGGAHRGLERDAHVDRDERNLLFPCLAGASSQSSTVAAVRLDLAEQPWLPDRSTNPTCQRSAVGCRVPAASSKTNRALPRQISSMPGTLVSGG
jgi:hypothetical protein